MKRRILLLVSLYLIIFVPQVFGAWKDTGFIQWKQPNGTTFRQDYMAMNSKTVW
jgi:hypothetical protein